VRKELLVNATPPETRVALLEHGRVVEVFHERRGRQSLVGNVYLGRVHRVLPGMQAAFVSIGLDRDAFLYVDDAARGSADFELSNEDKDNDKDEDKHDEEDAEGAQGSESARPLIDDLVREGQEIVVQVSKDAVVSKGPRVTAAISLAGRTLVYLPGAKGVGISRRITDPAERERLRALLEALPGEGGFIARTAAFGKSAEDLGADHGYLTGLAGRIAKRRESAGPPALLHREADLARRCARDLVEDDCDAIRVDDEGTLMKMRELLAEAAPALARKLELYSGEEPLFRRFGVEAEIENALRNRVALPSGGSIVIHQTEALVAIDVNTGKFVGKHGLEETVFATNLEAAPEVARQIRLRDLGGLLVVDFIDMEDAAHRQVLFARFEEEMARDRARTRILPISEFGLIEVTRQRSRGNLERVLTRLCPACGGGGRLRSDMTVALDLRRALLAPPVLFSPGEVVRVRARPSVARLMVEEDSRILGELELALSVRIELLPDESLGAEGFEIERGEEL
jgi:ribonuclease G